MADEKNIIDYLGYAFDSFDQRPIGDVDSLVLACISYFRVPEACAAARTNEGVTLHEIFRADWFDAMTHGLWDPEGLVRLLTAVAASPRFRDLRLCNYVDDFDEEAEKQFCACTLRFASGDAYLSFRGTDNTVVGWKEDFNMTFETGVPSQLSAASYLELVAPAIEGRIFLGGHSKGGNLAAYAAMTCDDIVFSRIEAAFSHDGPGFTEEALSTIEWATRAHVIRKTVPKSSLIGLMLERREDYTTVESTNMAAAQHDPFSWVVDGTEFVQAQGLSRSAGYVDDSINQWIGSMSREEREGFVDALFSMFYASGQNTMAGVKGNLSETLPAMFTQLTEMNDEQRGYLTNALGLLAHAFLPDRPERPERQEPYAIPNASDAMEQLRESWESLGIGGTD